ncbi:uncharacterized protein LOC114356054 [Ostrinia furnacalis]|uniref:uncharacterized protein LOC114356054 n=1 Tax=Ostrinia furnacalis TaxID=93504 RepID=UPI00103B330B|nr:uncharacterized protein LOC114356054 [Ostrinia furnacalis]
MGNKYYRNFILWGEVDFYCLLCVEAFRDRSDLDKHIRWENHRKLLKSQVKNHKFKKDIVYKVEELFYCEVCNYVAPSIEVMNTHVATDDHKASKAKPKTEAELINTACTRELEYVIVTDIIVEEKDWNCITHQNFCLVCGFLVGDFMVEHCRTRDHIINLIGSKVVVEGDKFYRKLYNDRFYCLCCKEALQMSVFQDHWTCKEHIDFKADCIFETTYATATAIKDRLNPKQKIEEVLLERLKYDYERLDDKNLAICNECQCVLKLEFQIMHDHKKIHENSKPIKEVESDSEDDKYQVVFCELTDHGQRRRELKEYGSKNFIRLNSGGSKGYCRLCTTTISGHLKLFKEHVRGARHRGNLELDGKKSSRIHKTCTDTHRSIVERLNAVYVMKEENLLCINKTVCLDIHSFVMVYNIDKRFQYDVTKCFICNAPYRFDYDFEHYSTSAHKKEFLNLRVLDIPGEFIRIVRNRFHCGTCNKLYPYWELMEKHLNSKHHKVAKRVKYEVFRKLRVDDKMMKITSKNPDILYLQLLTLGVLKSSCEEALYQLKKVLNTTDPQVKPSKLNLV